MRNLCWIGLAGVALAALVHCSEDAASNTGAGASGATSGTGNAGGGGNGTAGTLPTGGSAQGGAGQGGSGWGYGGMVVVTCKGFEFQCGNTVDDDGDGLADWQDPDCLGPCDNNEAGFDLGIPGGNEAPCMLECYYDHDTGSGNDDCFWNHHCDELEPSGSTCTYNPGTILPGFQGSCADAYEAQSQTCLDVCLPLVPNGCDCFGCCELPAESGRFVYLGSTNGGVPSCSLAVMEDDAMCHPCTPVPGCYDDCGPCELCLGKTAEDIPAWCFGEGGGGVGGHGTGGGGTTQCDPGIQPCGLPGQEPCPSEYYCITGCCVRTPR